MRPIAQTAYSFVPDQPPGYTDETARVRCAVSYVNSARRAVTQERRTTGAASSGGEPGAELIARARRVLLHEQHTGHADTAVKPGGLETFAARWAADARAARARGEAPPTATQADGKAPEEAFARLFSNYAALDPMQRTARVRAALALLDGMHSDDRTSAAAGTAMPRTPPSPPPHPPPAPAQPRRPPAFGTTAATSGRHGRNGQRDETAEPWPLATPPPTLTVVKGQRAENENGHAHDDERERPRPRAEDEHLLRAPVTAIPGVGPTQAARLERLGIKTVRELLFTFPREHRDYSKLEKIGTLPFDQVCTVLGMITEVQNTRTGGGRIRTIARIYDETGAIRATWFNQPYLLKQLPRGAYLVVTGVKKRFGNSVEFGVQSHELPEQGDLIHTGRLVPVYPLTEGLHPKVMRRIIKWAVDHCAAFVPEHLPAVLRSRTRLLPLPEAVAQMHFPDGERERDAARRRLAFDELFLIQLGMLTKRARWQDGPPAPALPAPESLIFADATGDPFDPSSVATGAALGGGLWPLTASCFEPTLPFQLTSAQRRTIREILADMAATRAMCRLLQGDVGSGKTVVAAAALLACAANGYQGAILAPTEILAEQHARGITALLAPFGLNVALLTGSQRAKERQAARDALANGTAAVAVGTHALIQEDVAFQRLGLAVVDEQHRFGVEQRDALRQKGYNPHMLVMTATPIPRTLALTLYGDLDVSVLDEMPAGRMPVITRWRAGTQRQEAYRLVAEEVAAGRQAYIICPLVEESETLEAKSAIKEYERLKAEVFPDLRLGLVHGQVKPAEKDRVMRAFRDGAIDVLVATAVVEVGVDVPNATVMLIEDADRFGLSQLHQFRGRVGRGQAQSYCYLLSSDASMQARERLAVMERTSDGFALAEADLHLRGPGDFFGTRQSGLPALKVARLADVALLAEARTQAEWLWGRDPYLKSLEHRALREQVYLFWQDFVAH